MPDDSTGVSEEAPRAPDDLGIDAPSVRFGTVLVLLTLIYLGASVTTADWITPVLLALASLVVIVLGAPRRTSVSRAFAAVFCFLVIVGVSVVLTDISRAATGVSDLAVAGMLLFGLIVMVRAILHSRHVDVQTVLGAVDIYILIGLFFGFLFSGLERLTETPFFAHEMVADRSDFLYFSFVSMTTLGFGDLTPADNYARPLTVFEVLIGQIVLVVVVARVVAMLGPKNPNRAL